MHRLPYELCQQVYNITGDKWTAAQLPVLMDDTERFPFIIGGERGGKSYTGKGIAVPHIALLPTVKPTRFYDDTGKLLFNPKDNSSKPRNPDFSLFGPSYAEPRVEFEYIEKDLRKLGEIPANWRHVSKPSDGPWRLTTKSGVVITTWSMDDPGTIRAVDLEMALICEAGRCPYDGIERVQGRVSAQRGPIIYSGTLEESQQWYRDWAVMGQRPNKAGIKVYSLPTWSNHHEFPGGRDDPEIVRLFNLYGEELFAQRCAGEPRPPRFRVLKEFQPRHVKMISLDDLISEHPDVVFEICVDPGYAFAYALLIVARWTEFVPEEVNGELVIRKEQRFHFFDEFYEQGKVTSDIVDMLQAHTLWPELNKQRMGVFDIASKGHRDGGDSALDIWKKRLPRWNWNMKYWFEDRLIERLRTSARMDHFTISPKCAGLLAEAGLGEPVFDEMHPWKYMTDRNGQVTGEKPIDKWNHSTKAMGYYLLHHLGQVESYRKASSVSRLKSVKAKSRYGAPSTK